MRLYWVYERVNRIVALYKYSFIHSFIHISFSSYDFVVLFLSCFCYFVFIDINPDFFYTPSFKFELLNSNENETDLNSIFHILFVYNMPVWSINIFSCTHLYAWTYMPLYLVAKQIFVIWNRIILIRNFT